MADIENERKNVRVLRKMTKQRVKNIALYYLKRFETSVANLRSVLRRRVNDYAYHTPEFAKQEAYDWIEEILEDFQRIGYVDDARFSELKIKDYLAAGKSPRYIQGKLREKGIDENLIERLISEQEFDPYDAALRLARKKHIGPFSASEEIRKERRSKDLAILVRAGFDYDVAVKVLETEVN
mgnify:FL=1